MPSTEYAETVFVEVTHVVPVSPLPSWKAQPAVYRDLVANAKWITLGCWWIWSWALATTQRVYGDLLSHPSQTQAIRLFVVGAWQDLTLAVFAASVCWVIVAAQVRRNFSD